MTTERNPPKFRGHTPRHLLGVDVVTRSRTVRMPEGIDDEIAAVADELGISVSDAYRVLVWMPGDNLKARLQEGLERVWSEVADLG